MEAKEKFFLNVCEYDYKMLVDVIRVQFRNQTIRLDYMDYFKPSEYLLRPDNLLVKDPTSLHRVVEIFSFNNNKDGFVNKMANIYDNYNSFKFIYEKLYDIIESWVKPIITRFDGRWV